MQEAFPIKMEDWTLGFQDLHVGGGRRGQVTTTMSCGGQRMSGAHSSCLPRVFETGSLAEHRMTFSDRRAGQQGSAICLPLYPMRGLGLQ